MTPGPNAAGLPTGTGATQGLGEAIARAPAQRGVTLLLLLKGRAVANGRRDAIRSMARFAMACPAAAESGLMTGATIAFDRTVTGARA